MKYEQQDWGVKVVDVKFTLSLFFQHDDLELWGAIIPHDQGEVISVRQLTDLLLELGMPGRIETENVRQFCQQVNSEGHADDARLITGRPPVDGEDGVMNLVAAPPEKGGYSLHSIISVRGGEVLARLEPPTPGTPGKSLKGRPVPGRPGRPAPVNLGPGAHWAPGSRPEAGTGEVVAAMDGRLIYERHNFLIDVSDTVVIDGNVDQKYGDIDFIGAIEITGDVEYGHRIKSGKRIKIKGNVESAHIEAHGDIEIFGGVSGKELGLIKSGGNLSLRYVDLCNIECRGNLTVKNEIVDSTVMAGGYVDVGSGSIIGGRITALGGIEARIFGSDLGVRTTIVSGHCYLSERRIAALETEEKTLKRELKEVSEKLEPFIKNSRHISSLNAEERQELQLMSQAFTRMGIRLKNIPDEIAAIRTASREKINPMVVIGRLLNKGVELVLDDASTRIIDPVRKCCTAVRNSVNGGIRFIHRLNLSDNARKIEFDVARAEQEELRKRRSGTF